MFDILLQRIHNSFENGLVTSFRSNSFWKYRRLDDNIFASLSALFVLSGFEDIFSNEAYKKYVSRILRLLPMYQNMHGGSTYNFWRTKPSGHFPNGFLLHRFKHFKLPDDIDDTALAFLLKKAGVAEVKLLREKIAKHSLPLDGQKTFAYNTWFGEKMPFETDVCVLSNLMFLFYETGLKPSERDRKTLQYLASVISEGKYLDDPFTYSRHYGSRALIFYHLARLMTRFYIPELQAVQEVLIQQGMSCLHNSSKEMDKLLIHSSLQKMGVAIDQKFDFQKIEKEPFYPFIGAPFAPFKNKLLRKVAAKDWAIVNWECDTLKWAYCIENLAISRRMMRD